MDDHAAHDHAAHDHPANDHTANDHTANEAAPDLDVADDRALDADLVRALTEQRAATDARIVALLREREGIVASADLANTDDEHDPEGATLAFEREQISALLRSARSRMAALDTALSRVRDGSYGICTGCAAAIPAGRLLARPDTSTCVACAGR